MEGLPLVSCLCVTRKRPLFLKRAIDCFKAQSYPNKELLVLYEKDDPESREIANSILEKNIRFLEVEINPKLGLGELRNLAIEKCNGEYFCQWDDDDWYHNKRLESQMKGIQESLKPASILVQWIVFDAVKSEAYISFFRPWEGSILCRKDIINNKTKYSSLPKGEDTPLINRLLLDSYLYPMFLPTMYIYIYHGVNTWDYGHLSLALKNSQKLSQKASQMIKNITEGVYSNEEASRLLSAPEFLEEIDYFFFFKNSPWFKFQLFYSV